MGKNKRKHPGVEETLARPWCYYCERDFDDLKILINHQKAKHYKCDRCGRRLNTAGGLSVHMTQVHKETLTSIENALPNRSGLEVEIFGMEGIPDEIVQSHNQRVLQSYAQAEADRRSATGNAGGADGNAVKKPKFESSSDLKKRLAEHKAKKAAEESNAGESGNNTPGGAGESIQSPGAYPPPGNHTYQQPHNGPVNPPMNNPPYAQYSPPFGQHSPAGPHGPPFQPPPQQPPQFQQQQQPPPHFQQPPPQPNYGGFQPPPQFHNGPPPFQGGPPQQYPPQAGPGFQPPPQFQNGPPPQFQGGPPQPYQPPVGPGFQPPPHFQNGPPPFHPGPPQGYGAGSPPPFQQNQFQPPRNNTPPQYNGMPQRPPNLPVAPGLPQRPTFGAPPVNAQELQQMHHGQFRPPSAQQDAPFSPPQPQQNFPNSNSGPTGAVPQPNPLLEPPTVLSANASSLDELVSGAAKDAENAVAKAKAPEQKQPEGHEEKKGEEKKGKKEKDKTMKLVYSDKETSPEEKMAQLSRYAFVRAA